jgi:hemoglobin
MTITYKRILGFALALTVTAGVGLAADAQDALYKSLGGKKAITLVVDAFVTNCATDSRISSFFKPDLADPARLKKFKTNLVNQICEASGGPCKYTGKSMKAAHAGMGITSADFGALVEDLVKAFDMYHVKEADKNALLGVLGPMKSDIVEK